MAGTMTAAEVQALASVSARTLRRWSLKLTRRGMYRRADVMRFLEGKRTGDAEQRAAQMNLARAFADENEERWTALASLHIPAATAREAWVTIRQLSTERLAV